MAGGQQNMPPGKGLQGTDLSDDHPISFEYSAGLASQNGELAMPGTISNQLPLDQNGQLQCTTCHDPHDSPYNKLLRLPSIGSQICVECHQQTNWQQSSHSQSFATWSHKPPNPWPDSEFTTVSDNGCGNCHVPHEAAGGPRLLRSASEEDKQCGHRRCYGCYQSGFGASCSGHDLGP
jgi:predicted CXXCH cytochrome family protein